LFNLSKKLYKKNIFSGIELGPPYEMFLRTMVILITMFVIYLLRNNKNDEFSVASFLLDNPISVALNLKIFIISQIQVHFGNLSYVLYLVHWPLLQFVKYYFFIEQPGIWGKILIKNNSNGNNINLS
jgi:peptidoglycan/LPS O-acetylase OafA/YrhL